MKKFMKKSMLLVVIITFCMSSTFLSFAANDNGKTNAGNSDISNNSSARIETTAEEIMTVTDYCEYYKITESDDEEFVNEVEAMLREREDYLIDNNEISTISSSSGSNNPLKKERKIPEAKYADIIWTNNPVTPFNHVGIYTKKDEITEALSQGVSTRTVGKKMQEFPFTVYKVVTKDGGNSRYSASKRKAVSAWAKKQVGKDYDYDFANNKENTAASNKKFNCSELVWKAWKFKAGVDLDSNGGKGVYPNNIKNSKRLKAIYQSK